MANESLSAAKAAKTGASRNRGACNLMKRSISSVIVQPHPRRSREEAYEFLPREDRHKGVLGPICGGLGRSAINFPYQQGN